MFESDYIQIKNGRTIDSAPVLIVMNAADSAATQFRVENRRARPKIIKNVAD